MKSINETIKVVFEQKRDYELKKKKRRAKFTKIASIVSCAGLLFVAVLGGGKLFSNGSASADYRILIDINPSIELLVDKNGEIKDVGGKNEDGNAILEETNVKGETTAEALKEIISEVVEQGYISPEANSVLVSIEGADKKKEESIKQEISESISQTLSEKSLEGAIIVQSISAESEFLNSQSETYGISAGKAQLIQQIINQNQFYTFEELSQMDIHDLNLLRVSHYIDLGNSYESGVPTAFAYIGTQRAEEIAQADAQVEGKEISSRLECVASAMLYVVEFETEDYNYRYRINAVTGEILSAEKIDWGKDDFFIGEQEIASVGENAALLAAVSHAGLEGRTLIRCKYNRDWVDGIVIYNIFFTDGIQSGRYVINARTGDILQ